MFRVWYVLYMYKYTIIDLGFNKMVRFRFEDDEIQVNLCHSGSPLVFLLLDCLCKNKR
jgi:hypothetical protein